MGRGSPDSAFHTRVLRWINRDGGAIGVDELRDGPGRAVSYRIARRSIARLMAG